jgi:Superinfection immunity protein
MGVTKNNRAGDQMTHHMHHGHIQSAAPASTAAAASTPTASTVQPVAPHLDAGRILEGFGNGIATLAAFGFVYMLPTIVAYRRHHPATRAIGTLNAFAGWTLVAWIAAMVWANTHPKAA